MRWNLRFYSLMALTMLTISGSGQLPTIAQQRPAITHTRNYSSDDATSTIQRQCPLRFPAGETDTKAIADLQTQLADSRKTKDMAQTGNTLNILGNIYRDLGLYSQALKAYDESISIGQSTKSVGLEAASLAGRAYTELELGQYDQAIAGFEQALKLRRTMKFPPLEILTLNNLGIAYAAQGNFQKAQAAYQQGLTIATQDAKAKPMLFTQWLRWNQANLKFVTNGEVADFAGDRPGFAPIQKLDRTNYGALMNNLALVYEAEGNPDEALKTYAYALQAFVPTGNFSCQWTVLRNQGRLLAQQGQTEPAIAAYYEAIGVTFRVLQDSELAAPEKAGYQQVVAPLYQELAALLKRLGRDSEAQAVLKKVNL
jgi:tetratricopeptide (TPR) repeat protein